MYLEANVHPNPLLHTALLVLLFTWSSACSDLGLEGDGGTSSDFAAIYESATFQMCKDCHAPGAPGFTEGTETTQDWSTRASAFTSLKGRAAGLVGNFAGCNGVPLVGTTSGASLVVAVLDTGVRAGFSVATAPGCKASAITDETLQGRAGRVPAGVLQDFKDFIDDGGFR